MEYPNSIMSAFATPAAAVVAILQLKRHSMDLARLSAIGRQKFHPDHAGCCCLIEHRMRYWGEQGAFWDGLWSVLTSAGIFWTREAGPLLVGGPLVAAAVEALENDRHMGGLGEVGAGLYTLGMPKADLLTCESEIRKDKIVLVYMSNAESAQECRDIFDHAALVETPVEADYVVIGA